MQIKSTEKVNNCTVKKNTHTHNKIKGITYKIIHELKSKYISTELNIIKRHFMY